MLRERPRQGEIAFAHEQYSVLLNEWHLPRLLGWLVVLRWVLCLWFRLAVVSFDYASFSVFWVVLMVGVPFSRFGRGFAHCDVWVRGLWSGIFVVLEAGLI